MENFLGQIVAVSFPFAPRNWALCNGQLLQIRQNAALFSLLGTRFGGDGINTFGLPDLRGRTPVGTMGEPGEMGGVENVTLLASQLPAHTHALGASGAVAVTPGRGKTPLPAAGNRFGATADAITIYGQPGGMVALAGNIAASGGSQPHSNMQPFLALNFIICLYGIYPSRS